MKNINRTNIDFMYKDEYFKWMYRLVVNDYANNLSYTKLLYFLYDTEFTYTISRDENRAIDGIDFRYRFGKEFGYSDEIIRNTIDTRPCSVLEMMIALASRLENTIMDDSDYGNRMGQWFWNMIVSLGLGSMNDSKFDKDYAEHVMYIFLNRQYKKNGEGGLFTLEKPHSNLRRVEIWYQAMWYLTENFS